MVDPRLMTFITVCKTRNYTKAAEMLNLTQPAVTKQLKYLEEFYGTPLLICKGRNIQLTEEGRILLEYAKEVVSKASMVARKLKNGVEIEKRYMIGATMTIGEFILPFILGKYKKEHPNHDLIMQVQNTEFITKKLLNGDIDLGLIEGPFDYGKFDSVKLIDDELVLAAAPQNEHAQRGEIELEEVLQNKLILREEGSGTRKVLEEKLLELGYPLSRLKAYMEIGSLGAIKSLVELDLGYTIISKAAIRKELNSGSLVTVPIRGVKIKRDFTFVYLKESPWEWVNHFIGFATIFAREYLKR